MAVDVKAAGMPVSMPWIDRLLRFDTTSRNSNLGLIETVRDELQKLGLKPWLTHNAERTKANLFVTLPATDGSIDGGVVLSGHTDVVPVDGQDWDTDPFDPTLKDGKLYARGSADMKSFIAIALTQAEKTVHMPLASPLHLALSFDEEVGCVGAPLMIDELAARGLRPQGCIVGEPTSMEVVVAHKGINAYRCKVHGRSAHSSLPVLGVNAIEYAARLVCFIRDISDEMRGGPYDDAFDTPYSTAQTGLIRGGAALNLVPEHCEFDFEFRNLPVLDSSVLIDRIQQYANDVLLPKMKAEHEEAGISFEKIARAPCLSADEQAAITKLVRDLARDDGLRKVAYGTEAGQFQAAGVPSIVCGPGDIRQAHRPNEFIAIEQIERCESFLASLVATMTRK